MNREKIVRKYDPVTNTEKNIVQIYEEQPTPRPPKKFNVVSGNHEVI